MNWNGEASPRQECCAFLRSPFVPLPDPLPLNPKSLSDELNQYDNDNRGREALPRLGVEKAAAPTAPNRPQLGFPCARCSHLLPSLLPPSLPPSAPAGSRSAVRGCYRRGSPRPRRCPHRPVPRSAAHPSALAGACGALLRKSAAPVPAPSALASVYHFYTATSRAISKVFARKMDVPICSRTHKCATFGGFSPVIISLMMNKLVIYTFP